MKRIFIQKNSAALRIWHWLTFLLIISLALTVLMVSTSLDQKANAPAVQTILKEKGAEVTNAQAWSVSHLFTEKMWDLHKLFGYTLSFLFLSRIVIEFFQSKEEKLRFRLQKALFNFKQGGSDKKDWRHYLIVKLSYSLFYLCLLTMVCTGLIIAFGADFGISGPVRHTIKEIHAFVQYLMYAFVFFHLVGVVLADITHSKGIVSGMINGGE